MALDLSGALSSIAGDLPNNQTILTAIVQGAVVNTVLTGLKNGGASSLDPLGLFNKGNNQAAVQVTSTPVPVSHPTIPASVYVSLPPAQQASLQAAGVVITAG